MSTGDVQRNQVEILAEKFAAELRDGRRPSLQHYIDSHPDLATEIRDLFPTIEALERLRSEKDASSGNRASLGPTRLERLGDLRIIREIGRGGMGVVFEAEQETLGRRVAVKVLPKQLLLEQKHLRRFEREAKTAAGLHHTNIVPVLGVGHHDGYHYYVMQYIAGVGLDEVVRQLRAEEGRTHDSIQLSSYWKLGSNGHGDDTKPLLTALEDPATADTPPEHGSLLLTRPSELRRLHQGD